MLEYKRNGAEKPAQGIKYTFCKEIPEDKLKELLAAMRNPLDTCKLTDILKVNSKAITAIRRFLHMSCLYQQPEELEKVTFQLINSAAKCRQNLSILGKEIGVIGITIVKSIIGSPNVKVEALKVLLSLSKLHKKPSPNFGQWGICCCYPSPADARNV